MRQDSRELQQRINSFLERKTAEHPEIERYAEDIYRDSAA